MTSLEAIACVLGILCVTLAALRRVWTFPFGIASVALYSVVFFETKLYSDALLQLFYIVVNAYGWWNWQLSREDRGVVIVETMSPASRGRWAAGCFVAALVWGGLMHRFTDASYPWADAAIAIVSVAAQILMAQRKLENWWLWIAVDVASIPLYAAKALSLTMGLYVIYLALAIWGLIDWHRARRTQGPAVA
ncbi:MAG TPA: nicotinamide riboside transporter PnuC [Sphingomonas sp.]|nr:nicotinamide riboside transporter PnuC [Sphingomonas sp.]